MLAQHILIGFEETEQLTVMSAYQTVYFAEQDIIAKQTEITEAAEEDKAELEAELAELEAELKTCLLYTSSLQGRCSLRILCWVNSAARNCP